MQNVYLPCTCGSGKKFKFCCLQATKGDPKKLLEQSANYPLSECLIMEGWEEMGLASIYVIRSLPNQRFILGTYLVDYYCLGIKETFAKVNVKPERLEEIKHHRGQVLVPIDYEGARSLILGGIEFAAKHGFEPQKDWKESRYIVEWDKPYNTDRFEFGKDGKPFYIQGPHDDSVAIMSKLQGKRANHITKLNPADLG